MRMVDLIIKKRTKQELSKEEIDFIISNYTNNIIPDYQMSSFAMAVLFNGMTSEETAFLTNAMMHSGDVIDLSEIRGIKVDKHSTGGVGDKTSLVLGPLVASLGAKVAKMSGRGLGHTGGTLDKMESIPGVSIEMSEEQFIKQVNECGIAIMGQTNELVPADKKLNSLRDVTGTGESIPLIASSIMSKKLATGSDAICLDVKIGSGAFCKTIDDARKLAKAMVEIGTHLNRDTKALITDMDQPLGFAIGYILEVKEAVNTLKGNGPKDLVDLCLEAGSIMLVQAKLYNNKKDAYNALNEVLNNGKAFEKLKEFISYQGGDISYLDDLNKFDKAKYEYKIYAQNEGYVKSIVALDLGVAAMKLGAGRATKDDIIDYTAGLILNKKVGDKVNKGELLITAYTNKENVNDVLKEIEDSFEISKEFIKKENIVRDYIE